RNPARVRIRARVSAISFSSSTTKTRTTLSGVSIRTSPKRQVAAIHQLQSSETSEMWNVLNLGISLAVLEQKAAAQAVYCLRPGKKRPPFSAGAKLPWFSLLRELGWRPSAGEPMARKE